MADTTNPLQAQAAGLRYPLHLVPGDPEFTFECELGSKGFEPCTSPDRFKVRAKRKVKKHKFRVRATDQRGNTDPTPAKRSWKVKRKR